MQQSQQAQIYQPSNNTITNNSRTCLKKSSVALNQYVRLISKKQPVAKVVKKKKAVTFTSNKIPEKEKNFVISSLFNRISEKSSQGQKRKAKFDEKLNNQLYLPKSLVNTLYRHNIKNYNPYIATLEQLQNEKELNAIQKQRISNLCLIGVAKNFLKTKKFSVGPRYSRVNVLIRTYMQDKMCQQVKNRQANYESVVFIPVNELALSFNPNKFPQQLQGVIPSQSFRSIITHTNQIIEKQYISYKESNCYTHQQSLTGKLILFLFLLLTFIFVINKNPYLLYTVGVLGICWISTTIYQAHSKLIKIVQSNNVTNAINQKLKQFFRTVKTDRVQWQVGQDFYWLEVHFIKKQKKGNFT